MTAHRFVRLAAAFVAAATLPLAPSIALAQGGGMGRMGGGMGGMGGMGGRRGNRGGNRMGGDDGLTVPEYVNGVNLLIQHRQDLSLSDTQFTKIVAIKRALDSTNAPLLRRVDSVTDQFKAGSGSMFGSVSSARRDSISEGRELINSLIGTVRDSVGSARDRAFALLSSQQLGKALDLQDKAQKDIDDEQKSRRGRGSGSSLL